VQQISIAPATPPTTPAVKTRLLKDGCLGGMFVWVAAAMMRVVCVCFNSISVSST